jgi:hypothetical protein
MPSNVLLVRIFIARPSDAEKEVLLIKHAVSEISKVFHSLKGVMVDAKDFKDLLATGGNPQQTINQTLLNTSDILVYIMHKSVGHRGFYSEIQKGLKRNKEENVPFIFYLKVPLSKREALSRTKFLEKIKSKFSYSEFKNDEELIIKIQAQLTVEIIKIIEASAEKGLTVVETDKQTNKSMPEKTKVVTQTVSTKALIKRADNNDLSYVINKALGDLTNVNNLNGYEKSRLYLHSASLIYGKEISSETLGNHEINLLYKYKEKVKPIGNEVDLIFRSLISDLYHQRAGWYWFQKISKFKIILYYSMSLFIDDSSDDVKIGALTLMDKFWDKRFYKVIKKHAKDFSENVQDKIIEVLTNHPAKQGLEIIEALSKLSEGLTKKSKSANISILFNIDIHQLIEQVIKDDEIKSYDINGQIYGKAYDGELQRLLTHKDESIRSEAFKEIIKRGVLTNEQLSEYIKEDDWIIRFLAVQELVNKNLINTPVLVSNILKYGNKPFFRLLDYREDELTKTIYKRLPDDKLSSRITWDMDGGSAYEIYSSRNWDLKKIDIRHDLKEEFKTKRIAMLTSMASQENSTVAVLENTFKDVDEFMRSIFIEAGLKVLLEKGDPTDKYYAYKFIKMDSYRVSGVCQSMLIKYGNEEDAQFLFNYSIKNNRIDTAILIKAFELDTANKHDLIEKGFNSPINNLPILTLSYCFKNGITLTSDQNDKVMEMLKNKDYSVRELACAYIINFYSPTKLKQLLTKYQSTYPYYYNVVSYLDMVLFSNKKLKNEIKKELTKKLLNKI